MGLRERAVAAKPVNPAALCVVAFVAGRLSGAARDEWLDEVNRPEDDEEGRLTASTLVIALREEHRIEVGDTGIQRHRRRQCACWRSTADSAFTTFRGTSLR